MRVLVTGGTGVIGASTITALLQRGHAVRLLSRHAERDARGWAQGVTPFSGDVSDAESVRGSGDDCDVVIHLVGVVAESPPEITFTRVNVEGTRNVVAEAERAGAARFIHLSSLGADRGVSPYHRSKREAEDIARRFSGEWTILRPGAVYGPGDDHVSALLKLVRTLPVVPMIGDGGQRFQPAWHEDIAEAIAIAAERSDLAGRTLELAGTELTSQRELLEMLQELTNRSPAVAPVPHLLASLGMKAAELVGLDVGFNESQLQMLIEGNVIAGDATNALTEVLGIVPTPLRRGLAMLADVQPEQLPAEGIGRLERKRYWVEIRGARVDADELFTRLRTRFGRFMASLVETDAEPEAAAHIEPGATLTLSLPLRGHVQVRVAEVNAAKREFTLVTVDGHPLAGAARFRLEERGGSLRFEVCVYERPATLADLVAMRALGDALQSSTWITVVENVVRESGGNAGEVRRSSDELGQRETREVEEWAEELVLTRKRDEASV